MTEDLVTAPTVEPVSLAEAKAQCEVSLDDATRDGLLETCIVAARQWAETFLRRKLCTQTWDLKYDEFPCAGDALELPYAPVQSVTSVKYLDPDTGTETTWSSSLYDVFGASTTPGPWHERAWIAPKYGESWPVPRPVRDTVRVRAVLGYGLTVAVPAGIKQGILLRVGQLFAQREPGVTGTVVQTKADEALLTPFRSLRAA